LRIGLSPVELTPLLGHQVTNGFARESRDNDNREHCGYGHKDASEGGYVGRFPASDRLQLASA